MFRSILAALLCIPVGIASAEEPLFPQRWASLALALPQAPAPPDLSELKIVVVAGEDAVNIVKKKTAVQPVVEVRDKNNTPVSGAFVTFTTPGNGASGVFSDGSHTLSVFTNSAGRAVVSGMQPVGVGNFHIAIAASIQGHVMATATIAQTNFLTAAAASAAGVGGAAGAAGGTATGVSTGVVIGIVAGAAAAAVVGTVVAVSGGKKSGGGISGTITGPGTVTAGAPQ